MEELKTMEDFSKELEASFRQINPGDILEGTMGSIKFYDGKSGKCIC